MATQAVIVRTDVEADVKELAAHFRRKYPLDCANIHDGERDTVAKYLDHNDVHKHGTGVLSEAFRIIAESNRHNGVLLAPSAKQPQQIMPPMPASQPAESDTRLTQVDGSLPSFRSGSSQLPVAGQTGMAGALGMSYAPPVLFQPFLAQTNNQNAMAPGPAMVAVYPIHPTHPSAMGYNTVSAPVVVMPLGPLPPALHAVPQHAQNVRHERRKIRQNSSGHDQRLHKVLQQPGLAWQHQGHSNAYLQQYNSHPSSTTPRQHLGHLVQQPSFNEAQAQAQGQGQAQTSAQAQAQFQTQGQAQVYNQVQPQTWNYAPAAQMEEHPSLTGTHYVQAARSAPILSHRSTASVSGRRATSDGFVGPSNRHERLMAGFSDPAEVVMSEAQLENPYQRPSQPFIQQSSHRASQQLARARKKSNPIKTETDDARLLVPVSDPYENVSFRQGPSTKGHQSYSVRPRKQSYTLVEPSNRPSQPNSQTPYAELGPMYPINKHTGREYVGYAMSRDVANVGSIQAMRNEKVFVRDRDPCKLWLSHNELTQELLMAVTRDVVRLQKPPNLKSKHMPTGNIPPFAFVEFSNAADAEVGKCTIRDAAFNIPQFQKGQALKISHAFVTAGFNNESEGARTQVPRVTMDTESPSSKPSHVRPSQPQHNSHVPTSVKDKHSEHNRGAGLSKVQHTAMKPTEVKDRQMEPNCHAKQPSYAEAVSAASPFAEVQSQTPVIDGPKITDKQRIDDVPLLSAHASRAPSAQSQLVSNGSPQPRKGKGKQREQQESRPTSRASGSSVRDPQAVEQPKPVGISQSLGRKSETIETRLLQNGSAGLHKGKAIGRPLPAVPDVALLPPRPAQPATDQLKAPAGNNAPRTPSPRKKNKNKNKGPSTSTGQTSQAVKGETKLSVRTIQQAPKVLQLSGPTKFPQAFNTADDARRSPSPPLPGPAQSRQTEDKTPGPSSNSDEIGQEQDTRSQPKGSETKESAPEKLDSEVLLTKGKELQEALTRAPSVKEKIVENEPCNSAEIVLLHSTPEIALGFNEYVALGNTTMAEPLVSYPSQDISIDHGFSESEASEESEIPSGAVVRDCESPDIEEYVPAVTFLHEFLVQSTAPTNLKPRGTISEQDLAHKSITAESASKLQTDAGEGSQEVNYRNGAEQTGMIGSLAGPITAAGVSIAAQTLEAIVGGPAKEGSDRGTIDRAPSVSALTKINASLDSTGDVASQSSKKKKTNQKNKKLAKAKKERKRAEEEAALPQIPTNRNRDPQALTGFYDSMPPGGPGRQQRVYDRGEEDSQFHDLPIWIPTADPDSKINWNKLREA